MELGRRIARQLAGATFERVAASGLANAELNRARVRHSLLELADTSLGVGDDAIVVGAGPSLHRKRSVERLRASGFGGTIVATDGALGACLRGGVVPHVTVSVDPHPERVIRWFGNPTLVTPLADDYFRRQEMDRTHAGDEVRANQALTALVNAHGPRISAALSMSVSPGVAERCGQAGMTVFWWNPMYDDYDRPDSVSRRLHETNGLPCLNGGGNVGTSAWVIAHAALGKRRVALLGFDLSYPPGQPRSQTQYYPELRELFGERFEEAFIHVENPQTREVWFCDPAYYWFRQVFLEMAEQADCETVNCTEGGILFGPGIETASLEEFVHG